MKGTDTMNDKEIGELRRRLRPDRTNITSVYGCYVSDSREILSPFRQSLSICTEDDKELYLGLLKKALSGSIDKNLLDLSFRTQQVADSDEHRLLMKLRETKLATAHHWRTATPFFPTFSAPSVRSSPQSPP